MIISRSIVNSVRTMDPPGRFLERDPETGIWSEIGDKRAIEKTSQALRDGAACLRKQLSADLGDPAFLSAVFDMDATGATSGEMSNKSKQSLLDQPGQDKEAAFSSSKSLNSKTKNEAKVRQISCWLAMNIGTFCL
jgi:hypothetical protein